VREDKRFQIVTRKHEIDLKREKNEEAQKVKFLRAVGNKVIEKSMYIYPDGFILLSMQKEDGTVEKSGVWLEIDRNTNMDGAEFKDRIRGIVEYYYTTHEVLDENGKVKVGDDGKPKMKVKISDEYIKKYGTTKLTVAYLITQGGQQRMKNLRELAQLELAHDKEKVARLFRFAVVPESWDYVDPEQKTGKPIDVVRNLLFAPVWEVPHHGHEKMSLINSPDGDVVI